jgi:Ca-activated chloride channel family protein
MLPMPPPLAALSDLRGHLADLGGMLAAVRFARPGLLWLLAVLPALALLAWFAHRRRRAALSALGRPGIVATLLTTPPRWGGATLLTLVLILLIVGLAGPRWGRGDDTGVAVGRDLVLVLDLSRSMLADDAAGGAARWKAGRDGLLTLIDAARSRGGHRLGLVVFAARPRVVCPLTTDYDHLCDKLLELDGEHPPAEIRVADDEARSGTRIGAALQLAVETHDPRFPGAQDILLVSDGDDPADDREWQAGVQAARKVGIPIHAVGVGDPVGFSAVWVEGRLLEHETKDGRRDPVQTQLNETPLQKIAVETRGLYLPARRNPPQLGEFFRDRIEPYPSRELADDALPLPRERYPWFLGPAVVLLVLAWWRGG